MSKRPLTPAEARAWARVAGTVRPIGDRARVSKQGPWTDEEDGAEASRLFGAALTQAVKKAPEGPLADRGADRRVRRGRLEIEASLDLHGHTQETAQAALPGFVSAQRRRGARTVLVITGKGRQGEGVLRRRFLQWLETAEAKALISGYAQAHPRHGGAGAWYLFLRRSAP